MCSKPIIGFPDDPNNTAHINLKASQSLLKSDHKGYKNNSYIKPEFVLVFDKKPSRLRTGLKNLNRGELAEWLKALPC